jgi:putative ABC transport system permease protein
MPGWLIRLRTLFRRSRMERELDAELAFHLEMQTAQYVARGMSPIAARRAARQLFGGLEGIKEDVRDTWLTRLAETAVQDIRYGLRGLRKHGGYAVAVIATMALGIGANSAIFSVVNAVVLQPLPYERGDDLFLLKQERSGRENTYFSLADIEDLKSTTTTMDAVVEYHDMYFILLGGWEPARVTTGVVSWDYFDTLGVRPLLGRSFVATDDAAQARGTLILSYEYWQRAFKGDPEVIGRSVEMNDRPHTIVGVLPDVPMYPQANDVYMPRSACPFRMEPDEHHRRGSGMAMAIGRRKPGTAPQDLQADLDRIAGRLQATHPESYPAARGHRFAATPLRPEFTREFESTLVILFSTSGFILLIVCASVANLSVARAMRRDRELSLRTALGASTGRLFRQLFTENLLLSLAGGIAGLLLAFIGMNLLVGYVQRFTTRASEIRIDSTVLLFTLVISMLTGLAAGVIPALAHRFRRGRGATSVSSRTAVRWTELRRALIVAQVAASFMLLIGAGLMLRSLWKLTAVDPGFTTDHVLTMQIDMNFSKYRTQASRAEYLNTLTNRLRALPGVVQAGAGGTVPFLENANRGFDAFVIEGQAPPDVVSRPRASLRIASEDYFRAMDIPLVRGRFFTPEDGLDSTQVVIITESVARRHWPGQDPIGQRISGDGEHWHTIVGVVASVRQQLALEPGDEIYKPMGQAPYVTTNWAIRSTTDLATLAPLVRTAVRSVDPDQPVHRLRPLDEVRSASLAPPRLTTTLLGIFAVLALFITATGIGGVIAFSVSQRTQELGVRVAFGATRAGLVSMIVGEGIRLALAGLAIGAVGAVFVGSLLSSLLFAVQPTDALTYASVSSLLLGVAVLACLLPALRAAAIDPIEALRVA